MAPGEKPGQLFSTDFLENGCWRYLSPLTAVSLQGSGPQAVKGVGLLQIGCLR